MRAELRWESNAVNIYDPPYEASAIFAKNRLSLSLFETPRFLRARVGSNLQYILLEANVETIPKIFTTLSSRDITRENLGDK